MYFIALIRRLEEPSVPSSFVDDRLGSLGENRREPVASAVVAVVHASVTVVVNPKAPLVIPDGQAPQHEVCVDSQVLAGLLPDSSASGKSSPELDLGGEQAAVLMS